jgi:hypothetical protein
VKGFETGFLLMKTEEGKNKFLLARRQQRQKMLEKG